MIARFLSFLLLLYALGFIMFSVTLGRPAHADVVTDSAVVITGGTGRIEHAMEVLADGKTKRVLIAGADPSVTKRDIIDRLGGQARLVKCCVDLGSESVDTRSNAEEAGRWLARHKGYRSVRLITSDWHMRRAAYEFSRVLGNRHKLVKDAVRTEPGFATLFAEYNKYLLRRLAIWVDV
jgi:uncharacterized SAM-binding protein YcdF (DUF218 family)